MTDSSVTFQADSDRGIVRICVRGTPDAQAIGSAIQQGMVDYPGYHRLWDLRDVVETDVTGEQVGRLARLASLGIRAGSSARVAILANEGFEFGMARMYEMNAEHLSGARYAVFTDEAEALAWLEGRTPGGSG